MKIEQLFVFASIVIIIFTGVIFISLHKKNTPYFKGENFSNCRVSEVLECNKNGFNCRVKYKYYYDNSGNKIEYYSPYNNWITDFELGKHYKEIHVFNSDGKKTLDKLVCDDNFKNCKKVNKYEYDTADNIIKEYLNCKEDLSTCGYINSYLYDEQNNKSEDNFICGTSSGIYCGKKNIYSYDSYNNLVMIRERCDKNTQKCEVIKVNKFRENNLVSTDLYQNDFNEYSGQTKFSYDEKGNKTSEYSHCNKYGENCSASYLYEYKYDDKDNIIEKKTIYQAYKNNMISFKTSSVDKFFYTNDNKLLIRQTCEINGSGCTIKQRNTYNKYGYLTEEYKSNGNDIDVYKYSYICD